MRRTNLRGHALRAEGKAYGLDGQPEGAPLVRYRGHIGQALCECGATSEVLWSDAARKRWHAGHKDKVRAAAPVNLAGALLKSLAVAAPVKAGETQ